MLEQMTADLLAGHDGYRAVQELPGIGPVLGAVIVAEIGHITRFRHPARLSSWAGLTPRHYESDTKVISGRITKMVCAGGTVPLRRQGGVRWRWLEDSICTGVDGQQRLDAAELSAAGRQAVQAGLRQIERLNQEMAPLRRELARLSSRQPGCRALRRAHYGIGGLLSVAVWAELGDCRRFSSSDDAVRHTGLDITIYDSDGRRARGHITRQGPPVLRFSSALAVSGCIGVAVGLPCCRLPHLRWFRDKRQRGRGSRTAQAAGPLARRWLSLHGKKAERMRWAAV